MKNLNVFFIHCTELVARQRVLDEVRGILSRTSFKNVKVNSVRIIGELNPQAIGMDTIQSFVDYNPIKEPEYQFFNQFIKQMHVNQLSNSLKHHKALEYITSLSKDDDINLILEDDVLFMPNTPKLLDDLINLLPCDYDMVFLGLPSNKELKDINRVTLEPIDPSFQILPVCDSYIISKDTAKKLIETYKPLKFQNNIHLTYAIRKLKLPKVMQTYPNLFVDGSKYGIFPSSINANNQLLFNRDYIVLLNIVNKQSLSPDDNREAEKLFSESQIKNTPEFLHLKAKYYEVCENFKKAESIYQHAYDLATQVKCIMNHDSVFLRDYLRLYRHLQQPCN